VIESIDDCPASAPDAAAATANIHTTNQTSTVHAYLL